MRRTVGQSNQYCKETTESFKIFVKQNRNSFGFSHIFDSEVCYCTKHVSTNKQNQINHINDNYIKFEVSLHFGGIWPTVWQLVLILCNLLACRQPNGWL